MTSDDLATRDVETYLHRYESVATQNQANLAVLKSLQTSAREAGIEFVPLKGMDLLLRCPHGLGHRPMYDIDLLVLPKDMAGLSHLFETSGYHQKSGLGFLAESFYDAECEYLSADTTSRLDVIWGIWYLDDVEPLWRRRVRRETPIGPFDLLHPEDALLYLIAYVVAHRGQLSSVFVQDLQIFLQSESTTIQWDGWTSEVRQRGLQIPVGYGLQYAVAKGLTSLPDSVLPALRPRTLAQQYQRLYYRRAVTERPRPSVNYLFPWIAAPGWRGKKRLLRRILRPPDQTAHWRGLENGGLPLSSLRIVIKSLQLLMRSLYVIPREIYRLFQ